MKAPRTGSVVHTLTVVALLMAPWSIAGTAHAADFPEPPAEFLIQAEIKDSGTRCATRAAGKAEIKFTECDKGNSNQHWFQRERDDEGYGLVFSAKGECIDENAKAAKAEECIKRAKPERFSWKQGSDGTVQNKTDNPKYWSARGSGDLVGLTLIGKKSGATKFTIESVG